MKEIVRKKIVVMEKMEMDEEDDDDEGSDVGGKRGKEEFKYRNEKAIVRWTKRIL